MQGEEVPSGSSDGDPPVGQATSRALGFYLAMARSFRAAWRGRRVPCSQLRTAFGLTFE
jgi:hypothetical protein